MKSNGEWQRLPGDRFRDIYDPGHWFQLPNEFLAITGSGNAAILLAYLCREYFRRSDHAEDSNGWFYRTAKMIENDLGMTYEQQKLACIQLREKGFIETCTMGLPAVRHFRLNQIQIDQETTKERVRRTKKGQKPAQKLDRVICPELDRVICPELDRVICHHKERDKLRENNRSKSNTHKPPEQGDLHFLAFWKEYPLKKDKGDARRKYPVSVQKIMKEKGFVEQEAHAFLLEKVRIYANQFGPRKEDPRFIKHPGTWLNKGSWDDEFPISAVTKKPQYPKWWETPRKNIFGEGPQDEIDEKIRKARRSVESAWKKRNPGNKTKLTADGLNSLAVELGYPGYEIKYWPCGPEFMGETYEVH
jgi:hypothetical protein